MLVLDWVVLIGLGFCFYNGLKQGLIVALASFFSLIVGLIGAIKFSTLVKTFFYEQWGWQSNWVPLFAFVLTCIGVILLLRILASALTLATKAILLGWLNRLAGGVFELLKGLLIACVLLALFAKINFNEALLSKHSIESSAFYSVYLWVSEYVFPTLFEMLDVLFAKSKEVINS